MRVGILGPLEVVANGEIVEIGGARVRTLLIRLAMDAGRVVTVESLARALWPEGGPANEAHALQSLVSRLRRALPDGVDGPVLLAAAAGYRLDLPADSVDSLRFERLTGQGRRALQEGDFEGAALRLREAAGLWRGEPLGEAGRSPFAAAAAARLTELRLTAAEDRVAADLETGADPSALVAELEELAALSPLRERPRHLLVKALHAAGRRAEALTAYEAFRRLLAEELGTDPGPELRELHLAVLRGEDVTRAARNRPSDDGRPPGNLRAPLTSFIGRAEEQTRIAKQLAEGRLVTLVGPGGAGKTRLATTVAAALAGEMPGGVWLVELAALTDPADVPRAVVHALKLREGGRLDAPTVPRDVTSRLAEALSGAETLLVLDNCEHLVDAAARLVEDLLGRCPRLRVIATGREPLGITGEALCPVPPLDLPAPDLGPAAAVGATSVRLFADRAAAVRPDFTVTEHNVRPVAEICHRLDGLPLAIELAAARTRTLPVEEIARRLADRFELFTGSRTALPRHRTLHAVVDWSWRLLDDEERRLARRLAVFPGTITPESAARVGGLPPDSTTALNLLSALADKSLLQSVPGSVPRYRMLETLREYALERLDDAEETADVRAAYRDHFLDLVERAEPHLRGPDQLPWVARLVAERGNLPAVLHLACDSGDAETAVRFAAALGPLWTISGEHGETASRLRLALEVPGPVPRRATVNAAVFYLINTVLSGGHADARATVEWLRTRLDGTDDDPAHPVSVLLEPAIALCTDDLAAGAAAIEARLAHPDPWTRAMLWLIRALLDANRGDLAGMHGDLATAVTAFRSAGERWGLGHSLTYLGFTHSVLGDFAAAIETLEESIRLLRELDPDEGAVQQRVLLAEARARLGDIARARTELRAMVEPGVRPPPADRLLLLRITLGDLARYAGDLEDAARQYDAAAELGRAPSLLPHARAMLGAGQGKLAAATGDLEAARRHLTQAFGLAVEPPDMPIAALVGVGAARLTLCHGAAGTAAEVLGAAHALRGAPDTFAPDVAGLLRELRERLGEHAHEAAYARGLGMGRDDALALIKAQLRVTP
ncbi:BTAD domain-containing putative transcriptional regulator [Actinomadura sp. HBU206391]|uniref:BTAD domain-containing putative transcriptional regulator n=1 Tax=Actinomadura sp. HBU206391 TaxID=2731692 RepID=UPI00165044B9|nr:BTAD domain-containing putative transcriptional regulator [Actinomadura sp. HBU206391]MBC6461173.1 AAA family ATPase [Actinomadura sp. HBU206391]